MLRGRYWAPLTNKRDGLYTFRAYSPFEKITAQADYNRAMRRKNPQEGGADRMQSRENQRGAVTIIEATFVFPIMFIVIFIMLMACEGYLQYARAERACIVAAIQGAARCENPMLEAVQRDGTVPTSTTAAKVRPYRYILTSEAQNIADQVGRELEDTIEGFDVMCFRGMTPSGVKVDTKASLNILVSSFSVDCSFKIKLPIRMIFSNEDISFAYTVSVSEPIGDPAEFVRNVSTVQDYLERSEVGSKIEEFTAKISDAIDKVAEFIN